MNRVVLLSLLLLVGFQLRAQEIAADRPAKAIYVEALGSGLGVSINYDTRFKPGLTGLGIRAGIGGLSVSGQNTAGAPGSTVRIGVVTLPVLINYVVGNSIAAFEAGAGLQGVYISAEGQDINSGTIDSSDGFTVGGTMNFGLRLQPRRNGVHFRLYWAPIVNGHGFQPKWLGLSLGFGFR